MNKKKQKPICRTGDEIKYEDGHVEYVVVVGDDVFFVEENPRGKSVPILMKELGL